jgi:PKD repeat protein
LVGTEVTVGADFTDPGTLDTHMGTIDWGDGSVLAADLTETGGSGSVSGMHTYTRPGVYTVRVSVADDDGGTGASILEFVV